jgi:hypothetical protein
LASSVRKDRSEVLRRVLRITSEAIHSFFGLDMGM